MPASKSAPASFLRQVETVFDACSLHAHTRTAHPHPRRSAMRKMILIAAAVAAAFAAQAADTPGSNPSVAAPTVAERLANARKALAAKDFSAAMRELNVAVREDPRNADVHNLLGYSYRKRSSPDITKAFEHYYTALRIDPRHKGAHE
jgi:Tfp pilus assembly protein PilF